MVQFAGLRSFRIVGRTTLPGFGTSGMSESILHGITGNPWNLERSARGSSSGAALGTDAASLQCARRGQSSH
ncbi:amidase family protein [Bradyrhizobium sp. USDA 336]|uniref:amidase family protein n=1 Tax=Bradyrhizobium sp. USDA 336 TaxID=3156311 RepID=UPI00384B2B61